MIDFAFENNIKYYSCFTQNAKFLRDTVSLSDLSRSCSIIGFMHKEFQSDIKVSKTHKLLCTMDFFQDFLQVLVVSQKCTIRWHDKPS